MGTHVPATHTLKWNRKSHTHGNTAQDSCPEHASRAPPEGTPRGRPAEPHACRLTLSWACVQHTQGTGSSRRDSAKLLPRNSPPRKLHAQGTKDPVFTPRGSDGSRRAGGSLFHMTSVDLLMRHRLVPPCSEPSMAPLSLGQSQSPCSGLQAWGGLTDTPSPIIPVLSPTLSSYTGLFPDSQTCPQGLCTCCFHCLFSLTRICMILDTLAFTAGPR